MEDPLLVDVSEGIATLTFNRPDALNALNGALRLALVTTLTEMNCREDVRVIILTAKGRAFCAGLDVKELSASGTNVTDNVQNADIGQAISACGTPIIAAINGLAVTGGFEITLACDMVLVAESAYFRDTHAKIGLLPGWGLSQRLPRIIGPARAKDISLTARKVSAQEAAELGFVNRVVADDALQDAARDLAREIAQWPREGTRSIKSLIDDGYALPLGEAFDFEVETSRRLNAQVTIGAKE